MRRLGTLTFAVALVALSTGCKQQALCPALGDCGGPAPVGFKANTDGEWVLAPDHGSCSEDLYIPATDTRLAGGNLVTAGTAYPEPAVFDWCVLLVTGPGAGPQIEVNGPRFYYESGPIGFATVKFHTDGSFSTGISRTGTFTLDFPGYCIRAFGAMAPSDQVCQQLEEQVRSDGKGEGAYQNTRCYENTPDLRAQFGLDGNGDPDGCLCRFDVDETGGPAGTFVMQDQNTILDFPDAVASNFPQRTKYCAQGDDLQLTGADGAYLFDQKGLRTMDLVRTCKDSTDCASGNCCLSTDCIIDVVSGLGICK